ncbi:MAG TPA: TetR family transcriptional regulator [Thermoleophilaceae bacterium]|nr:TetR family transcriptional regulator [Thermoleophilaceae bacterium]
MAAVATPERTPYAVAARELLRDTLLDAARDLLGERDWAEVTMADIATAGGVSRQTLYSEFGSRAEFAQALFLREADRFLGAVEDAVNVNLDDPVAALGAAFDVFLRTAAENPLIRAVVAGEGNDSLLPYVTTQGQPVVEQAADRLAAVISAGWPHVDRDAIDLLADCGVRLAISYAALPTGPADTTAASVATLLGPYLERVVAEAEGAS